MTFTFKKHCLRLPIAALTAPALVSLLLLGPGVLANNSSKRQTGNLSLPRNEKPVYSEIAKAPAKARARHNPFEGDANAVLAGAKLFARHCAECHGSMADGGKKGPSLRDDEVQSAAPGALFWILTNGVVRRGMPVWSKLPEPQRWQIVSFLKSLRETSMAPMDPGGTVLRRP